jgi:hypothetical protein
LDEQTYLQLKVEMVMMLAGRIKSYSASRTGIPAPKILCDRQSPVTFAAKNGVILLLVPSPYHRRVAGQFLVTTDTCIEGITALKFYRNDIGGTMVVRTLSLFIDTGATHHHPMKIQSAAATVAEVSLMAPLFPEGSANGVMARNPSRPDC